MATAYNVVNIETLRKNANREYENKQYQYQFAFYLKYGFNQVHINLKEAFEYFKRASEQGHIGAAAELGMLYYNGGGVEKNREKGIALLEEARIQGCARAHYVLGHIYKEQDSNDDLKKADEASRHAVQVFEKQCEEDKFDFEVMRAVVQHSLGFCYASGEGVAKDVEQAVRYYQLAAKQGDAGAQYSLGVSFENGEGVAQDFKQAVHYYELAVKQGYTEAECNLEWCYQKLGSCYKKGEGVVQDFKQAVHYFQLAEKWGNAWAQYGLGVCYQNGEGVPQDVEQAMHYYQLAAGQENAWAQYNLGFCYYRKGVEQGEKEADRGFAGAQNYYEKAALSFCFAQELEPSLMNREDIPEDDVEDFKQAMLFCKQITEGAKQYTHNEQTTEQKDAEKNKYSLSESIEKEIIKKYNYDQIRVFFESFNELEIKSKTQTVENMQEMMHERFKNLSNTVSSYLSEKFNVDENISNILFQYTGMMFDSKSKKMGLLKIKKSKKQNQMSL